MGVNICKGCERENAASCTKEHFSICSRQAAHYIEERKRVKPYGSINPPHDNSKMKMEREKIVSKIKEAAQPITMGMVEVFTSGEIYPKCYLGIIGDYNYPKERVTPDMLPTELLAYVRGKAAMAKIIKEREE